MKSFLLIMVVFLLSFQINSKKILFHEYQETSSDWDIIKWNLTDTIGHKYILKETIDNSGRVKQLDFLENGKHSNSLCYLANKITFEYKNNSIIETLYWDKFPLYATDCEMYYKRIYHLDTKNYILKIEQFALYNNTGLSEKEINQWKKWVPKYSIRKAAKEQLFVDYYSYSYSKMNGVYPISRNFKLPKDNYYGDQPERESIENGIKKLKNNKN